MPFRIFIAFDGLPQAMGRSLPVAARNPISVGGRYREREAGDKIAGATGSGRGGITCEGSGCDDETSMPSFFQLMRAAFVDRIRLLEQVGAGIPRIGRTNFGRIDVVLLNTPELVPELLLERADDFRKSPILRTLAQPLLGNGLLTSEGEAHREHRKLVAPAFAHQRVSRYAEVMTEHTSAAQSAWREGQRIDIAKEMMRLTLGIVGRALFDVDLLDKADRLGADITTILEYAARQLRVPFQMPRLAGSRAAFGRLNETIYGLIRDRRASGIDKGDLLSMLLISKDEETEQHLTDEQARDEAMTLFVAGHETTAQAMAWSWYLLAKHPQYFERLRTEGMPFALRVMKESMRLYPPVFILARQALRDTAIGGFGIRKDEIVFVAPWLFHRDARSFEDPLRFDPDRFLPERESKLPRYAYMPFGGGKRICLGNQFALMEGQIILATIGQHVRMEPATLKPPTMRPALTLRAHNALLRVHRLN